MDEQDSCDCLPAFCSFFDLCDLLVVGFEFLSRHPASLVTLLRHALVASLFAGLHLAFFLGEFQGFAEEIVEVEARKCLCVYFYCHVRLLEKGPEQSIESQSSDNQKGH